jgi:LDH2 family malate/lactate/ureidoglycolate dehydrogenase
MMFIITVGGNMKKVSIEDVKYMLIQASKHYVSLQEAEYFAHEVLEVHMRKSPRLDALRSAVTELGTWKNAHERTIKTDVDKGASLLLNFMGLAPSIKLQWLHDEIEQRAHRYGISFVGFYNTGGVDWLTLYTLGLSRRGLIGICMFNGGPGGVIPYGGTDGFFGTNPLSYAIPTDGVPVVADMATSEVPFFEYSRAKKDHKKLPRVGRVTADGVPTDDPENGSQEHEARLLPMGGGYKGYAINFLIEIMTGNLVRSISGGSAKSKEYTHHEYGGVLIGIDIASFTDVTKFTTALSAMTNEIHKQKSATQGDHVSVPGDQSGARLLEAQKRGVIEVDEDIIQKLQDFGNIQ